MKTTLPAVLFVCALIGLTGISTAKAASDDIPRFRAFCVTYDRHVVSEDSVSNIKRDSDGYITMITADNRTIITGSICTFTQINPPEKLTSVLNAEDKQFPEDGEPRYAIGH
jgi:ligand-binding sensor domain-containing protein